MQANFVKAEAYFKRALKIREEQLGPTHSRVGQTLKHMLTLYEMQEKFTEALESGTRALAISEKIFGVGSDPPLFFFLQMLWSASLCFG